MFARSVVQIETLDNRRITIYYNTQSHRMTAPWPPQHHKPHLGLGHIGSAARIASPEKETSSVHADRNSRFRGDGIWRRENSFASTPRRETWIPLTRVSITVVFAPPPAVSVVLKGFLLVASSNARGGFDLGEMIRHVEDEDSGGGGRWPHVLYTAQTVWNSV